MAKFSMFGSVNMHLVQDGNILLLRRFNTGWKDGEYSVVAGHMDGNESVEDAMRREAREEAGIELGPCEIVHAQHRICNDREYIDFHVRPASYTGKITNLEPDKCDDLRWFPLEALPDKTITYMRLAFDCIKSNIPFSEYREPDFHDSSY